MKKTLINKVIDTAKNVGNHLAKNADIYLISGAMLFSLNSCSTRQYLGNTIPTKETSYSEDFKYKQDNLILDNTRYVLKKEDGKIIGINQDYTKLNESTKDREWDENKDFIFAPAFEEIAVGNFKQSRKLRKNKSTKITEKDYKYDLKDFLKSVRIGNKNYLAMQKKDKLILFEVGKFESILNEENGQVYLRNKPGQIGIYIADIDDWMKTSSIYQATPQETNNLYQKSKEKEQTKKYHTRTINKGDTLGEIAKEEDTTVKELLKNNPGIDPYNLKISSRINIRELK